MRNTRGSTFSLCRRSRQEPERFVRYPRLPVLTCPGYERRTPPVWSAHLPPGVTASSVELTAGDGLAAVAIDHWRRQPARAFLQDVDGTWITGRELEARTLEVARRLGAAGLCLGDRVALGGGTSAALVCAYVGVLRAGLVAVPVNPGYTRGELERLLAAARPAAVLPEGWGAASAWLAEAAPQRRHPTSAPVAESAVDRAGGDEPALLLYTSGTTGTPKGALLSHANLLAGARAVTLAWRWSERDRLLLALPLFHMHGLGVGVGGSLVSGGQLVLHERFDADAVADRCGAGEITMLFGVPAIYQRLLAAGRAADLAPLRLIVSGSAPLPAALSDAIVAACGQRPLERYGMTETVMLTSNLIDGPRKAGRVGLPLPGVELRLAADGEVQVRGPSVIGGYDAPPGDGAPDAASGLDADGKRDSQADAEAFTPDGWFRTGDLGELDEDGHLRLVGRSKELIISGGLNVHPREVEEVLSEFPGVREVAVVGRPSHEWGEAVTAVVVAEQPLELAAVRAFAARRLADYKLPKSIELVDALPRNALGKLLRHEL